MLRLVALLTVLAATALAGAQEPAEKILGDVPKPLGTRAQDFSLKSVAGGGEWSLVPATRDAKATVLVFVCNGCPVSNAYLPRLAEMHKGYTAKGVRFVAVNSHPSDSFDDVAAHAKDHAVTFPVLKDDGAKIAERFRVERFPTAFVLDATRTVRYLGRVDDQHRPGATAARATTHELADALDAVLAGNEVLIPSTKPAGCLLTRDTAATAATNVTYTREISRIVQANCQSCHRPGGIGPFSLTSYKHARGWSEMIAEVVRDDRMPPWHADAARGHFKNDRRLSPEDKKTILAWVEGGCPEGDPKDLPAPPTFLEGWAGGTPDRVLTMVKAFDVPAQAPGGGVPYHHVLVGEPFAEETWVRSIEVRPGDRGVVHHALLYFLPPGADVDPKKPLGEQLNVLDKLALAQALGDLLNTKAELNQITRGMLGSYVPGDVPVVYPVGYGKRIPKGAQLYLEMHYTPSGRATTDRTSVGLSLAAGKKIREVKTAAVFSEEFAIPPSVADYEVTATLGLDRPVTVLSFNPHMHLRGKSFTYHAEQKGKPSTVLLSVPKYDFGWQQTYILAKPLPLAKGTTLKCVARFDNSAANLFNPDPKKTVRYGEQTWEEMMIGFLEFIDE